MIIKLNLKTLSSFGFIKTKLTIVQTLEEWYTNRSTQYCPTQHNTLTHAPDQQQYHHSLTALLHILNLHMHISIMSITYNYRRHL